MNKTQIKIGFTLAEVIITIGIIGIVAALVIPLFLNRINNRVKMSQLTLLEQNFVQGLSRYNTLENGLSGKVYNKDVESEEFVKNLSKYYKMVSICGANELEKCFPYENIRYEYSNRNAFISVSDINLDMLRLSSDNYYAPAGFLNVSGVSYIIALKKDCWEDPDISLKNYSSCISGLFDYNGSNLPNKYGKDIIPFGDAMMKNVICTYDPNGVCIPIAPFYPSGDMAKFAAKNCSALKNGEEVVDTQGLFGEKGAKIKVSSFKYCINDGDYWLASKIKCESMGYRLPTEKELAQIAAKIYGYKGSIDSLTADWKYNASIGDISEYGIYPYPGYKEVHLWSDTESQTDSAQAYTRNLNPGGTNKYYHFNRNSPDRQALCVLK